MRGSAIGEPSARRSEETASRRANERDEATICDGGARRKSDNKQTRSKRTDPMRAYEDAFSSSLSAFFAAFLASRRSSFSARRAAFFA